MAISKIVDKLKLFKSLAFITFFASLSGTILIMLSILEIFYPRTEVDQVWEPGQYELAIIYIVNWSRYQFNNGVLLIIAAIPVGIVSIVLQRGKPLLFLILAIISPPLGILLVMAFAKFISPLMY